MSDNGDVVIGVAAKTDQTSFNTAKTAVSSLGNALDETTASAAQSQAFDKLAEKYADIAKASGSTGSAIRNLRAEIEGLGGGESDVQKASEAFREYNKFVDEAVVSTKELAEAEKDVLANTPDQSGGGRSSLQDYRDTVKSERPISGAVGALRSIGAAAGKAGLTPIQGGAEAAAQVLELAKSFSQLKAATSALPEALKTAASTFGLVTTATEAGTTASAAAAAAQTGQTAVNAEVGASSLLAAAGMAVLEAALTPLIVVGAAVAVVLAGLVIAAKIVADGLAKANDDLKGAYDAQRKIQEFIRGGATSEEAQARLDQIQATLDDERNNLANAKADYAEAFNAAANSIPIIGDLFARIADLFGAFSASKGEIDTAAKSVKDNEKEQGALNKALETGKFKANDAKKAAEDKAKADEKAAADAKQTSDKRASDEKQAADKAAQQAEQQAQQIQSTREAITKAGENFANKQVDLALQAADKITDIQQAARDKSNDTDLSYYRDTVKLASEARNKEADAKIKASQAEYDAVRDTNRKLEDLRHDALSSEEESTNDRNFLQAVHVREGLEKANKEALTQAERGAEDRATTAKREEEQRYTDLNRARDERKHQLDNQIADNKTALDRQLRDARTQQARQLNEAEIAYARETDALQKHLAELGGLNQQFYAHQSAMAQAAANGGSTQAGITTAASSTRTGLSGAGSISSFGGLRPITTAAPLNNITNHVTIQANTSNDVYKAVLDLGLIE